MARYTAFLGWQGQVEEEMDIDAPDIETARRLAQGAIDKNYQAGITIFSIEPRFGMYF